MAKWEEGLKEMLDDKANIREHSQEKEMRLRPWEEGVTEGSVEGQGKNPYGSSAENRPGGEKPGA